MKEYIITGKEQKSKLESDLISRQAAIESMAPFDTNHELRDTLDNLPPVDPVAESVTTTDCISRQAAIEAVEKAVFKDVAKSAIESLPPVTPTESEDCVSREDLLKHAYLRDGVMSVSVDSIKLAPSVIPIWRATETMIVDGMEMEIDPVSYEVGYTHGQTAPIERTGEWIVYSLVDEGSVELECPECGDTFVRAVDYRPHFCENCGAKMKGGTENE